MDQPNHITYKKSAYARLPNHSDLIINRFDYRPFEEATYKQRVEDLKARVFDREGMTRVLENLNQRWNAPDATLKNIKKLNDENSVVVIGGQQAGLLSGPIYTINKIVSIINFAKLQEEKLGVPVIPIFWIAGEDHDFDEINHIMLPYENRMRKYKIQQRVIKKQSISKLELDKNLAYEWINRLFEQQPETEFSANLLGQCDELIKQSNTYVDFFARFIFRLFKQEGIVLVDSGDNQIRKLEVPHFTSVIKAQEKISEGVYKATQELKQSGYQISMDVDREDAHLFYEHNGERVLLVRESEGKWLGKQNQCEFTTEEMLQIAESSPEKLSNNVVTRPLMQELLFPTLAFLGGPGEVGYWATLKPAFSEIGIKMPPVLPRLSITLMDYKLEKILKKYTLEVESILNYGADHEKGSWLAAQSEPPIETLTDQIKLAIERAHKPLRDLAKQIRSDLGEVAEKNLFYLLNDIDFLEGKLHQAIEQKYSKSIQEFDAIQVMLHPEGGLQERCWNIISLINLYGFDFVHQMVQQDYSYEEDHYLFKL